MIKLIVIVLVSLFVLGAGTHYYKVIKENPLTIQALVDQTPKEQIECIGKKIITDISIPKCEEMNNGD